MWGTPGDTMQDTIQVIILLIAFICIPWMLFPKPCIEIRRNKKVHKDHPLLEDELAEERDNVNHSEEFSKRSESKFAAKSAVNDLNFDAEPPHEEHDSG